MSKHNLDRARQHFFHGMGVPEKTEFLIDEFQREAIDHVVQGHDTLVVAPTGSGKTYIAVEAIQAAIQMKGRAIYTTPLKALSNTKYNEFKAKFEPNFKVGLLTGDRKIEGDASVVVATTEIFRNELYNYSERYSVVVLDEVHFIADPQRGPVWEESIILAPRSSTLLMLSASISNPGEIAEWISEVREKECKIVIKKERSIQLRFGFFHPDYGVIPLESPNGSISKEVESFYLNQGGGGRHRHDGGGRDRNSRGRGGGNRQHRRR